MLTTLLYIFATFVTYINGQKELTGLAYAPLRKSGCASAKQIEEDFDLMSKVTDVIRTYGCECEHAEFILKEASKRNMKVFLGIWVDNKGAFEKQFAKFKSTVEKLSTTDLKSLTHVIVGNEVMHRGEKGTGDMIRLVKQVKGSLPGLKLPNVKVSTCDTAQHYKDPSLLAAVDYLIPNMHSFFGTTDPVVGSQSFFGQYDEFTNLANGKELWAGETGWASQGKPGATSEATAGTYLNHLACSGKKANIFYFEAFDATWKKKVPEFEYHWGIADENRQFKPYFQNSIACDGSGTRTLAAGGSDKTGTDTGGSESIPDVPGDGDNTGTGTDGAGRVPDQPSENDDGARNTLPASSTSGGNAPSFSSDPSTLPPTSDQQNTLTGPSTQIYGGSGGSKKDKCKPKSVYRRRVKKV